ncbi:EVE domain-containing protein [uncultured Shewanella sp.]|uniref:EVE domain-containing protein n=1 Tax=uncultured Shewanella sp. TaxID=173975 RepID=UPI002603DF97|nr:EVE domain-containing protein [uncultured Shewanella sp.]
MAFWLMKSEPDEFSIDDLAHCENQTETWDGIRNYQARNFLRDKVELGDIVFFYHSSCKVPGIVGLATVSSAPYIDQSAFDQASTYFDGKSSIDNPRWVAVDLTFKAKFSRIITLTELKADPNLTEMVLVSKGARLSVQPVTQQEFDYILSLE